MISIRDITNEVQAGLYGPTREALAEFEANLAFFQCRNRAYLERRESEDLRDFQRRPKQFSRLVRKAVRTLSSKLYQPGPLRTIDTATDASELLNESYKKQHINAVMSRADQHATLNGVCAIQVVASGIPEDPARYYLWGRHEFVPYFQDDDPLRPWCVVTKSIFNSGQKHRRRYQIWTAEEIQTWYTDWLDDDKRGWWDGTAARLPGNGPDEFGKNPYGVLPFAFVHNELPVDTFDGSGIGSPLREANSEIDRMLSDQAEALEVFAAPKMVGRNLAASFRWRDRTDGITRLIPQDDDPAAPEPAVEFLQPQLNVTEYWLHIEKYANQTFEDLDVPIKAVRGEASWDKSGIAIVAEMSPLVEYTQRRQVLYGVYEESLKETTLAALGNYYGDARLLAASAEPITLAWPPVAVPITPERDQSLQWGLDAGIESRTTVVMQRYGMTEDEAVAHLERVAEQKKYEDELFPPQVIDPMTGLPMDPNQVPPDGQDQAQDDEAQA
jgi:hypothetical protein